MLRDLEIEIARQTTAVKVIEVLARFVDQEDLIEIDFLSYTLLKVLPKVYKYAEFESEFGSVLELICLKSQQYDLFVAFFQFLPQIVKDKKVKALIELVLKSFFSGNWVRETCETKSDDEIIAKIFKFRSIVTNFLEGCPYFMIDHVYYCQVFIEAQKLTTYQKSQLVGQIALHGLIDLYTKESAWFLHDQIAKHSKKDQFLSAYLQHGHISEASQLYTSLSSTLEVSFIQRKKNLDFEIADRVLLIFNQAKDKESWLETVLKFWQSGNLCRLGSPAQHLYLTYLAYELMNKCTLSDEITSYIQNGVQERIQIGQEDLQKQGMLIWKTYMKQMGYNQEADVDDLQFTDVTAESVFSATKPIQLIEKVDVKQTMYAENDSDNDSDDDDFNPKYKQTKDNYKDLTYLDKPLFLSDLVQSFSSDDFTRHTQGLNQAESLIRNQNLNDLEQMTPDLLAVLFRTENKFELDNFLQLKYGTIQAVCEMTTCGIKEICVRLLETEASLGDKILLMEVIGLAGQAIAQQYQRNKGVLEQNHLEEDKFFFGVQEHPMVLAGRITRRLTQTKIPTGKANLFLKVAEKFVYPLIFLLENFNAVSKFAQLLAKGLYSLALCMDAAMNHWQIEKFSQDCFGLWLKLKDFVDLIASMPDADFVEGQQVTEAESRSRWASITMNLAFMLSKCRKLKQQQIEQGLDWLKDIIEEKVGGSQEATAEVCKYVHATLIRNH